MEGRNRSKSEHPHTSSFNIETGGCGGIHPQCYTVPFVIFLSIYSHPLLLIPSLTVGAPTSNSIKPIIHNPEGAP